MNKILVVILVLAVLTGCIRSIAEEPGGVKRNYDARPLGASAADLLGAQRFKTLHVEIQYTRGARPQEETLDNLRYFLNHTVDKPGGIIITLHLVPTLTDTIHSIHEVVDMEQAYRTKFTGTDRITLYLLFTNSAFANDKILGMAYRNTSAVLFSRHIRENSGGFRKPRRSYLESRILLHEVSHLLGLVNTGTETGSDHHDAANGQHCTNRSCLMYHLVDTKDYPSFLIRQDPPKLCEDCQQDLQAAREKIEHEWKESLIGSVAPKAGETRKR